MSSIVVRGVDPHLSVVPLADHLDVVRAGLQSRSYMLALCNRSIVGLPHSCFRLACLGRQFSWVATEADDIPKSYWCQGQTGTSASARSSRKLTDCTSVFNVVDLNLGVAQRSAKVRTGLLHAVQLGLVRTGVLNGGERGTRRLLLGSLIDVHRLGFRLVRIVDVVDAEQQEPVVGRRLRLGTEGEVEARVRVGVREAACSNQSVQGIH